jgi:hypothetical protein
MKVRYCDGDNQMLPCPHPHNCTVPCGDMAVETRKVKPYPAVVPDDIEPAPEVWHTVGAMMLTAIFGVLAVVCILLFFAGAWIWSLLL